MNLLSIIIPLLFIPSGESSLTQVTERDSVLIADQLEYGFRLDSLRAGTVISLPDWSSVAHDTIALVRTWQARPLKVRGRKTGRGDNRIFSVRGYVVLAPFEEGTYELPPILVQVSDSARCDTLVFAPSKVEVKSMPVDTATFEINDIKGQIRYPLTFAEVAPYVAGGLLAVALAALLAWWLARRARQAEQAARRDPPHIVALRELDKYRSDRYWAPDKQKTFYSGITDTLRTYIDSRFGIDAPEMTTAELFEALKSEKDIPQDLFAELKELFECADFVKFAKFTAGDDVNAAALPTAVRFVTDTYRVEIEQLPGGEEVATVD
ncbi:MAG: hypothetical protein MJY44_04325 [Bacteroidales bacterium]|nr:hypothetical protein [Bacteroidales bacterium]